MSQNQMILNHLATEDHITALQAIGLYRCFRLSGRILDLRKDGWDISTEMVKDRTGKTYARYRLSDFDKQTVRLYGESGRGGALLGQQPSAA